MNSCLVKVDNVQDLKSGKFFSFLLYICGTEIHWSGNGLNTCSKYKNINFFSSSFSSKICSHQLIYLYQYLTDCFLSGKYLASSALWLWHYEKTWACSLAPTDGQPSPASQPSQPSQPGQQWEERDPRGGGVAGVAGRGGVATVTSQPRWGAQG